MKTVLLAIIVLFSITSTASAGWFDGWFSPPAAESEQLEDANGQGAFPLDLQDPYPSSDPDYGYSSEPANDGGWGASGNGQGGLTHLNDWFAENVVRKSKLWRRIHPNIMPMGLEWRLRRHEKCGEDDQ